MDHASRSTLHAPRVSRHSPLATRHSSAGFTMVEIAISLAVIGFALVAIVGILPIGMGMQKQNRQETVINQDASVFLDGIRNGAQGMDYLTNYVIGITNDVVVYSSNGKVNGTLRYGYGPLGSTVSPTYALANGYRIIGLLSTPKYVSYVGKGGSGYFSNHVVAYFRSLSGPSSEKFPQNNTSMQDLAFSYRLIPEIVNYGTYYNPTLYPLLPVNNLQPIGQPPPPTLQSNLNELRLTFRWPLVDPKGKAGPSQQSFRCTVGGWLKATNEVQQANFNNYPGDPHTLYFFQPRTYASTNSLLTQ